MGLDRLGYWDFVMSPLLSGTSSVGFGFMSEGDLRILLIEDDAETRAYVTQRP